MRLDPRIYRPWLEEAVFAISQLKDEKGYAYFLQRLNIFGTTDSLGGSFVAGIKLLPTGMFELIVHWPTVSKFDLKASCELLKHEILHAIMGHLGTRYTDLIQHYGRGIAAVAIDLVVNQYCDITQLERYGIRGVHCKDFKLPTGQTLSYYAAQLWSQREKMQDILDKFAQEAPTQSVPGDKPVKGKFIPLEWIDSSESVDSLVDEVVGGTVKDVMDQAAEDGSHFRGLNSGDYKEFIAQVRRKPKIPWYNTLRQLEARCRTEERIATPLRPSRRHPTFLGRKRKTQLHVVFGVDTSGSMGHEQLKFVQAELEGILSRGASITLLQVDAEVQQKIPFTRFTRLQEFYGRGGTDFSPFLLELAGMPHYERPQILIFFTDGYGCIRNYVNQLVARVGQERYDKFLSRKPTTTPEGVELLWVLPQGTSSVQRFRTIVPFGSICVLPTQNTRNDNAVLDDSSDPDE